MDQLTDLWKQIDWDRWSGPALHAGRIILILVAAWVAMAVVKRALRIVRTRVKTHFDDTDSVKRTETLTRVMRYLATMVIGTVAAMLVLAEVGVSLAPILGAAGVVGLAVGFGAQSLVKDYFTGFFLLFEDQIRTGDVVTVAGLGGVVEDITLRHVRLRDYAGDVHYIPNSLVTTVTNSSRSYANAVLEIGVSYRENLDEVMSLMTTVAKQLREDPVFGARILADLEIAGVERLDHSAVVVKGRIKAIAGEQWGVRREYLRRVKHAFDENGIEIPYPHVTFYAGVDKDGKSPALPLSLSRAAKPS